MMMSDCALKDVVKYLGKTLVFSERELTFTFAMLSPVRLSSVCLSSVMFVRPTQAVQIFGNISTALGTWPSIDIH